MIATYTELQSEIASWMARGDLTAQIPTFIRLCESELNRVLRVRQMEQRSTAITSSEYLALPDGYLELRDIQLNTTPRVHLEAVSPSYADQHFSASTGRPLHYCLIGNEIQLVPAPDAEYELEIDYFEVIPPLADNETNWLLDTAPDVYLYGSLLRASGYIQDANILNAWRQAYMDVMQQLQGVDEKQRWSGSRLSMRPGMRVF